MEQQVDLPTVPAHELVQDPRRDGRLAQLRELGRLLAPALTAKLFRQAGALGAELVEVDAVQPFGRLVERHLSEANHPHRMKRRRAGRARLESPMTEQATVSVPAEATGNMRLAVLLAMAMFVLVVDTSLMNVSISAVVRDLDTTASGVQSAIALEALVSAAFILIGSKIGDLFGRKRAYILGLSAYAIGALSMVLSQSLLPIVIFWAVVGGLGASLLLPAMQSLIHGNFQGAAQRRTYALVGAAAAIAAAVGPLLGGFITTYLSWRVAFGGEVVIIACVLLGSGRVHDAPYTGERGVDVVGAVLSALGMGGVVLGILVWEEGGGAVGALFAVGVGGLGFLAWWLRKRKREGKPALLDVDLFKSKYFRFGITGQTLQQIALGGMMIALPIYLQMVLEYNAMEIGRAHV